MEADRLTRNNSVFHPGQLYWIILLQSSIKFIIHSVKVSSTSNATMIDGWSSIINTPAENLGYSIPILDISQLCMEDISWHLNTKSFYCHNSSPSFLHQIVVFRLERLHTAVSTYTLVSCGEL